MSGTGPSAAPSDPLALMYLNDFEARTVEAITERIIPAGEVGGAAEAGVVYYIDRALAGFSTRLQQVYRLGLRELDAWCDREFSAQFVDLPPERQDAVVRTLLGPEQAGPGTAVPPGSIEPESTAASAPASSQETATQNGSTGSERLHRLFAVIREHTIEGYFGDPVYGGNRDAVGWRLVGFPGAQWGYTAGQMQPGFDSRSIVIKTLSDLRAEITRQRPDDARFYSDSGKDAG
jgi:gluconate 2-dehydrogenase gamma chain